MKETNASSANAQSNGWTFQYVAALVIYLENMNRAVSFCVEGTDDIVLYLKDGKIAAQAKSGLSQDSITDLHFEEIMESIRTLSLNNDSKELISISNFHAPLGIDDSFSFTQFLDKKKFNNLTSKVGNRIKEKCNEKGYVIDFEKFKLWFIRFEGDSPELSVEHFLKTKLVDSQILTDFSTNDLMNQWLQIIQLNARDKKNCIETDTMCGTLFGKILASTGIDRIMKIIRADIDPCYEDQISHFFKYYFSKNSQNFRIYSDITFKFFDYVNKFKPSVLEKYKNFVDFYCKEETIPNEIIEYFSNTDSKKELSLTVYKLFVAYICYRKDVINSIRRAFNYEDN